MKNTNSELIYSSISSIQKIVKYLKDTPGCLLPILHEIQDQFGYIPPQSISMIAQELNLTRAEIHGVITFYHYFRLEPKGKHILYICRAESCQSMGSQNLEKYVKNKLSLDYHETTQNGNLTIEPIYCLGNCACSPSVMLDNQVYGRMNETKTDELLEEIL